MKRILTTFIVCVMAMVAMAQTSLNQSVLFAKDSVNVSESQMARIELMVSYIKNHPSETVFIGGFTSNATPQNMVQKLCDQRAEAVKKVMTEKYSIPADKLIAIGVGVSTKYEDAAMNEVVEFFTTASK